MEARRADGARQCRPWREVELRQPLSLGLAIVAVLAATIARAPVLPAAARTIPISYADARAAIVARAEALPPSFKGKMGAEIEAGWPAWVTQHNADIRARLERGDEDSLVNFWLYGTSFTRLPRATDRDLAQLGDKEQAADLLGARLDDLAAAIAKPGTNERLRFARQVIERHGIDPDTSAGQEQARNYLIDVRARVVADNDQYRRVSQSAAQISDPAERLNAYSSLFRDRGLSSDTSLRPGFAIETTMTAMKASGRLAQVRRVGIVGPGLDFSDKAEGYDFYPQQTIQPFGVVDSLLRLGFSRTGELTLTTFDLSPRVNQHLEGARQRAAKGGSYVVQLPLDTKDSVHVWQPDLVSYWRKFGSEIGVIAPALRPPRGAEGIQVRAVKIRPSIVSAIQVRDTNIVLERSDDTPFDLIVATNILVYYDGFEQALALTNIAKMLRPGGFLLTNYKVSPLPPMEADASLVTPVFWDRQGNGDTLFWYQRR